MFEKDAFAQRERALEDEFFHRVDEKLRSELRRSMERDRSREALSEATGLNDPELLDELLDAGLQATTLAALALVPAVFVAWADDTVTQPEKDAVLKAATERGMNEDGMASQLLVSWLEHRPRTSLWDTWKHYADAVRGSISESATGILSASILQIATSVANASGGVLGFGKISAAEKKWLTEIENTLLPS